MIASKILNNDEMGKLAIDSMKLSLKRMRSYLTYFLSRSFWFVLPDQKIL